MMTDVNSTKYVSTKSIILRCNSTATLMHFSRLYITLWLLVCTMIVQGQSTLYLENFNGQNGQGATGSGSGISIDTSAVDWSVDTSNVTLTATDDYMKVVNDTFEFRNIDGPGKWSSPSINISNYSSLTLGIYLSEEGSQASNDSVSIYYAIDGGSEILIYKTSDDFTTKTLSDTAISGTGSTLTIHVYARNTAGTRFHRIDDVILKGTSTLDANSNIVGTNNTGYTSTKDALLDSDAEAFSILSFTIVDSGSTDAAATKITNIQLTPGDSNNADWTDHLQGVKVHNGSSFISIGSFAISDTAINIPITSGNLDIANNSSTTVTVYAYFNTSNITDSAHFDFKIDPSSHGFTTDGTGSSIQTTVNGSSPISSGIISVYVIASNLKFVENANNETVNQFMRAHPSIELVDANGNRDVDFGNYNVKIISSGTLEGDSSIESHINGLVTFDSLKHSATGGKFVLTAICNHLTVNANVTDSVVSDSFSIISQAGLSISDLNTLYKITFDSTIEGINNGQYAGSGISTNPTAGKLNADGIAIDGFSDGNIVFGMSSSSGDFARGTSTGGESTGGMYAFETSSGNMSIGFQSGASDFTPGSITIRFQNNTGTTITELMYTFEALEYNDQDRGTKIQFSYSSDNTTFITNDSLKTVSTETKDSSPSWRKHLFTQDLTGLSVADGDYYYIRFDFDDSTGSGSRDEIAIDNIGVVASSGTRTPIAIPNLEGEYNTLNINGGSGTVTASGAVTVYDKLKLKSGFVNMNNFKLTLGSASGDCEVSEHSSLSFVFGGVIRNHINSSSGSYVFPFGTSSSVYSRSEIVFNSSTLAAGSYIEAEVTASKHPNFESSIVNYLNRYYDISATGISSPNYNIVLYYDDTDVVGTESSLYPVKYDGSNWQRPANSTSITTDTMGQGAVDISTNKLTWTGVTSFSIYGGAGDGIPLPVDLIAFEGKNFAHGNLISWNTSSESNSQYFELQKRSINSSFETIKRVEAAGQSNELLNYSVVDELVNHDLNLYRLRLVDFNTNVKYSRVIEVLNEEYSINNSHETRIYKQHDLLTIDGIEEGRYQLKLYSATGKLILSREFVAEENSVQFSLPNLETSVILGVINGQNNFRKTFKLAQ